MKKTRIEPAFTLAEVLITLGIIGVVAALTIPTVLQNMQTQQTVSALKKSHSILNQAYNNAVRENGTPDNWGLTDYAAADPVGAENLVNTLAPYLNISKNCGRNTGCFLSAYKTLNNSPFNMDNPRFAKARLSDGTLLMAYPIKADCTSSAGTSIELKSICGYIVVDINGLKIPNQFGVDLFWFYLTKQGITPIGTSLESPSGFANDCSNSTSVNGYGCAAWVLYNENVDYLKCPGILAWDGPTKCN